MPSESEEGRRSLLSLKLSVTLSHVSGLISLMFCFCTFYLYSWSSIDHRVALLIGKITSGGVSIWRTWIQSMITSKLMSHAVTQRHGLMQELHENTSEEMKQSYYSLFSSSMQLSVSTAPLAFLSFFSHISDLSAAEILLASWIMCVKCS